MQDWSPGGQLTGTPTRQDFRAALDQLVRTPTKRPHAHLGALALVRVDSSVDRSAAAAIEAAATTAFAAKDLGAFDVVLEAANEASPPGVRGG